MALEIIDNGANNQVVLDHPAALEGRVVINGDGAFLYIGGPLRGGQLEITMAAGSRVSIGETLLNNGTLRIHAAAGGHVEIGTECAINGVLTIQVPEPSRAKIGRNCLFSDQVFLQTSDHHAIFDRATRQRINPAADIHIGPRVWLGQGTVVLKGAEIGRGAIIGANAVVTGRVPDFCTAAGNPARIIRENVTWGMALQDEMPAALDNPRLYDETPPQVLAPQAGAAPDQKLPDPAAPVPDFRLLRARHATVLKAQKVDSSTLDAAEKLPAPDGAWLMTRRLTDDGEYWRMGIATLDGAPIPPHINLALKTHWDLLPL